VSTKDIAVIVVGALIVAVVVIVGFFERPNHHHRFRFGVFFERNGDEEQDSD